MTDQKALTPYEGIKKYMRSEAVKERFMEIMNEREASFYISSAILAVGNSDALQKCEPNSIAVSAFRAALLQLTVDPSLGRAYIVPFGNKATFIVGYKGLIELATRTGKYRYIHCAQIYEGMEVNESILTGVHNVTGGKSGKKVIGYLAYFEMNGGYTKSLYMTVEEIHAHAKKYSKSYDNPKGLWKLDPAAMERKTPLRLLLLQWGQFSHGEAEILKAEEVNGDNVIDGLAVDMPDPEAIAQMPEESLQQYTPEEIMEQLGFSG
jgi:recombination protein RecT